MERKQECGDVLSRLPDSLLVAIISFLPFKEAARTSVLSKRCRYIWHETKNIEFNQAFFEEFQQLIQFAMAHKAKCLDLDFSDPTWDEESMENHVASFELPSPDVYQHRELEELRLFSCNFRVLEFKCFKALKSLSLGWTKLSSSFLTTLCLNCKFLESLSLKKCWDLKYLDISGSKLRTLVIDRCLDLDNGVVIDAPKLQFFKYSGRLVIFMIEYLNAMVEADLNFGFEFEFGEFGDIICDLLRDLWSIRVLTVCSYILQVIPSAEEYPLLRPPLEGIRELTMKTTLHAHEFHGISFFLNSCPLLERLTIDIGSRPTTIFSERGTTLDLNEHEFLSKYKYMIVYGCLRTSLRVIEIKGFKGGPSEVAAIKYFLRFGLVLEALFICVSKEKGADGVDMEPQYRENARKLLQFPTASKSLAIFDSFVTDAKDQPSREPDTSNSDLGMEASVIRMNNILTDSIVADAKDQASREPDIDMGTWIPRSNSDLGMEPSNNQIQVVNTQVGITLDVTSEA
ncbi:putative F-box/LRR-repeat protein At1g56400 [Diospyros lotus]|uniref:putative F-box/LRR-repeat protein At1g56400 n=1 Tax=Diospyros lotus TaxID=55363 RepID=UPI002258ECFE|nr:putative F-box/LRR-repeat protein At1g56400 [Diospyros lotus]